MIANSNSTQTTFNFKVVLLGEGCVGKTSIVLRYVEDKFNSQHISTLQASFLNKKMTLEDGKRVQLNIWDTAGQERFHALGPIYYRGSHGAILVYDITDQDSFQKVKNWVKELKRMLGADIVITIVGNKTDLEAQRTVEQSEAIEYSESMGAHYFETSAKANEGIEELFFSLTKLMTQRHTQREQENSSVRLLQGGRPANMLIVEDSQDGDDDAPEVPESHRACCGTG
ncbi:ras-related protein Rab-21-like [Teleopsis dalmanni]|uniref:ras-related protein Rab-21-like n=1 Tax=Teleopsis dalmanni TaxID=139649 RepID=UPI0018CE2E92|nr:ras-related protein Rab-21-like [Teleopsis dalmanni]